MLTRKWRNVTAVSAAAIILSGCSFSPGLSKQEQSIVNDLAPSKYQPATRETRNNIETQDNFAQAAFWSREYQLNPADLEAAIKLSAAVRKMGNPAKAVEIAQNSRAMYPRDPYLLAEFAAALIASERSDEAIEAIDGGLNTAPGYARLWSLKGAALDQLEQYDLARKHYGRALQITPRDPNIMSNLGLNYALAGDPVTAETWMRRAAAQPGAGANIQQNLNLILQLQGKQDTAQLTENSAPDLRRAPAANQSRTYGQAVQAFESRPRRAQSQQRQSQTQPQGYAAYESRSRAQQARPQQTQTQQFQAQQPRTQKTQPQMQRHQAQRPQTRTANNTQASAYGTPAVTAPASGDFSYRSNVTIIGGENGAQSASDMARAAAAKSRGQNQKITVPAGGTPPAAAPVDILSRLSNSVGPRRMQPSAQTQYQRQAQYQAQTQTQPQVQPQVQPQTQQGYPAPNYGYQQPAYDQPYSQQPVAPRGAARRR